MWRTGASTDTRMRSIPTFINEQARKHPTQGAAGDHNHGRPFAMGWTLYTVDAGAVYKATRIMERS